MDGPQTQQRFRALALFAMCCCFVAPARAESFTTNIIDSVTTNAAGPFTLGDAGPFNFLLITNGGSLTDTTGVLGNTSEAHANVAVVIGSNSVWQNTSNFIVGATGALNQVSVMEGAKLGVGRQAFIGLDVASGGNVISVSGPGAFLDMPWFHLGHAGSGNQIIVADGARAGRGISNDLLNNIGEEESSAENILLVTGAGTSWHTDGFRVGHRGPRNRATVRDGASLTNGSLVVGREVTSTGNIAEVIGPGTAWKVQGPTTFIGFNGSNNLLRIADGARFEAAQAMVGFSNSASGNRVELWGAGTVWSNASSLVLGRAGPANVMAITDGAILQGGFVIVGSNSFGNELSLRSGSQGTAYMLTLGGTFGADNNRMVLDGAGTVWTNFGSVWLGDGGSDNTLEVANGARLELRQAGALSSLTVGRGKSERNLLHISGAGTFVHVPSDLAVGSVGSSNVMILSGGANVASDSGLIGVNASATRNHAIVTDPGTLWTVNRLSVGVVGRSNLLTIANGATVRARTLDTGGQTGQTNHIVVTGTNSLLFVTNRLDIRDAVIGGELLVLHGGRVYGSNSTVGFAGPGQSAQVVGPGSSWSNTTFQLGDTSSSNRLFIAGGGRMDSRTAILGTQSGSSSNVAILTGGGTSWNVTDLTVGFNGSRNQLIVSAGARLVTSNAWLGSNGVVTTTLGTCNYRQGDNQVVLTDPGSVWENHGVLRLGYQSIGNRVAVGNGATMRASSIAIGDFAGGIAPTNCPLHNQANVLLVDGGCLFVTNAARNGTIESRNGPLRIWSGRIEADRLHSGGGGLTRFELFGGVTRVRQFSAYTAAQVIVGDGRHNARLEFNDGYSDITGELYLQPHASISGRGNIYGFRTNNGTLGNLTGQPSVLEARVMDRMGPQATLDFVIAGASPEVTHGTINLDWNAVLNGRIRVGLRNGFIPAPGDTFRIISFSSATGSFLNATNGGRLKTVDGLGSFLVSYSSTGIALSAYQTTDLDEDDIEDAWATNYFSHSPLTPIEQQADVDGDGASSIDEFRAGTDPTDPNSVFKAGIEVSGDSALVKFDCVDGKSYRIRFSNDLQSWHEVPDPTFAFPEPGHCEWLDDGKDTDGKPTLLRFYRVLVD